MIKHEAMCSSNHYLPKYLFWGLPFFILLVLAQIAFAAEAIPVLPSPHALAGEELNFDIGFWLFKKAAYAHMTLKKTGTEYVATFEAQTSGFIGFLTRNVKEVMTSVMQYDTQSGKFKPTLFQEVFTQGKKLRKKTVMFNYAKKTFTITQEGSSIKTTIITRSLPKKHIDDLLTAFYNFRLDSYGEVKRGKVFNITICTKERPSRMIISVPEDDKVKKKSSCTGDYGVLLSMDKDLTQIASKQISGWISNDLVPVCGVVEDAYLFGDLTVQMKERKFAQE